MSEEDWEVVFSASGMAQASIVQGRLETEGIPVQLNYESAGPIFAITIDGLGEVKVMVPGHLVQTAREVLAVSYADTEVDEDIT
jgi:hypothetical protein